MRSIYAAAEEVIVVSETTETNTTSQLKGVLLPVEPSLGIYSQPREIAMALWGSHRSAVKAFFEDPYWNRIWIAQEFAINPNVQFLIQDVLISSEKVETLFSMMYYRPSHANRTLRQARVVYNIRRAWQTNQHFQLLEILLLTRNSKCGRRHDRIFGLLVSRLKR